MAAPEEQELSQAQTEKLLQFQDLTGLESTGQCRRTLEQHNWNIEAAVQDRLNEQEGVPSVFNPPPSRPLQVNTADHRVYSYIVSRPQPRGLIGWSYHMIMLPFRLTYYTLLDIFRFALRWVRPDPRGRVTDPVGDVVSFIHSFEEKYGRSHPVFYQGTYSQVCYPGSPVQFQSQFGILVIVPWTIHNKYIGNAKKKLVLRKRMFQNPYRFNPFRTYLLLM
ncbi:unnamed protein product [Oncorhynchus mykiss]|uniref:UBA-like domain-containing protein n=1 Tax=Oncorhynchus mykiss TaxID=8022 RepID=A0A060Y2P3_ONCMY|nr:unnamed protein product [Oncorhynchus mykiss]